MAQANLNNSAEQVITDNDTIAVPYVFLTIPGGRTLDTTGFLPEQIKAGHVIIVETSTSEYKPMPATIDSVNGVATLGTVVPGTGYANGTYENVPLSGGTGRGALATVVVASTVVSTVTKTYGGDGYAAGDVLTANNFYIGGTGTGFSVPVSTISNQAGSYGSLPSGHTYAGILISTILTKKPFAAIMVHGRMNPSAAPFSMSSILTAVKTALPLIDFRAD